MVSNNTILIVIIIASLIGATEIGAYSAWEPNSGIEFFSTFIFLAACSIGLGHYIWECKKRLSK